MKKLLVIGGLLSFIVVVATACQKRNKEINNTEVTYGDSIVSVSKEKASTDNSIILVTDSLSNELIEEHYEEISYPPPNIDASRKNTVEGVILHHTAEPTVQRSLDILTNSPRRVGTHCVIDTDGTRYIMCKPEVVTYHAGLSVLNGKEGCNNFTIGIEFQGNTLVAPLTEDQMKSAIEYLRPIIKKYNIPYSNVVTHEMIRQAYKKKHPQKRCSGKVDITQTEYKRFMKLLKKVYDEK